MVAGIRKLSAHWALSFLLTAAAARGAVTLPGMRAAMDAMSAANAERLAVREERELVGVKSGGVGKLIRCSPESIQRTEGELGGYMARQGCVGVSSVLSKPTAATLRQYIDAEVEAAKAAVDAGSEEFSARFGGVNCRGPGKYGNRQDLFLSASEPVVAAALGEAFKTLAPLLRATVGMDGAIHEASARPARRAPRARGPLGSHNPRAPSASSSASRSPPSSPTPARRASACTRTRSCCRARSIRKLR